MKCARPMNVAQPRLLLFVNDSPVTRRLAEKYLRSHRVRVTLRHGNVGVVAVLDSWQLARVREAPYFGAIFAGPLSRATIDALPKRARPLATLWSFLNSDHYRRRRQDPENAGRSWGDAKRQPPGPPVDVEPRQLQEVVLKHLGVDEKAALDRYEAPDDGPLVGKKYVEYYERLKKKYRDANTADFVARIAYYLKPGWRELLANLDGTIFTGLHHTDTCRRMMGNISVGIVFVESGDGGPTFTSNDRNTLEARIADGLQMLAEWAPADAALTWVLDFQFVTIDGVPEEPIDPDKKFNDEYWSLPGIGQVSFEGQSFTADAAGRDDYLDALKAEHGTSDAMIIFVSPYNTGHHAYASSGISRIVIVDENNFGGWGIHGMHFTAAHEVCHIFGAGDEYSCDDCGTPCSDCSVTRGCFHIPNGNCQACADPHRECLMTGHVPRLCAYTRGQIGWADLLVEVTTSDNEAFTGTDDDVEIDFGDHAFVLDDPDHNDFESSHTDAFAFEFTGLTASDIKRVALRKSPDGWFGGWKPHKIRVFVAGDLVCDRQVNLWIDNTRLWHVVQEDATAAETLVNTLEVRLTTADEFGAGTDNDVTIEMGGRSWNLDNTDKNDFEQANTDKFLLDPGTGLTLNMLETVRIRMSANAIFDFFGIGNWKLAGMRILVNGDEIYDNQSIDHLFTNEDLDFFDNI